MLPMGLRFLPSDEELITGYLLRKATDQPLPWNGILERNIYGKNNAPWDVFGDIVDDSSSFYCHTINGDIRKKTMYVFTKLVKAGPKSKRISRTAGCGTWSGQTGAKEIKSSITGKVIGSTKMFEFKPDSTFGHWIMHEYSLDGVSLTDNDIVNKDLVLCKITRVSKSHNIDDGLQERGISSSNKKRTAEDLIVEDDQVAKKQRSISSSPSDDFSEIDELLAKLDDVGTPTSVLETDHELMKEQISSPVPSCPSDYFSDIYQILPFSKNFDINAMFQWLDDFLPPP